jgi:hypothetical protein
MHAPPQEAASNASQGNDFATLPDDISEEDALTTLMGRKGSRAE